MTPLARAYHLLMQGCGVASAALLGVIALLVTLDVALRNLGFGTLPWIVEVSEYSLPVATFLSAPWLLYRNAHVRVEVLVTSMPLRIGRAMDVAADLIGLAGSVALAWFGMKIILDSRGMGALIIKTLVFPEWWLFAPLPAGATLLALEFMRRLARGRDPAQAP